MRNEIKPLTGIRGIAAFVVMLYHFFSYPVFANSRFILVSRGYLSVDLFFILSGFVLAMRHENFFNVGTLRTSYGDFLKARIARIYPAYFIFILLYYAKWIVNISGNNTSGYQLHDIIANVLLVQSWGFPVRAIVNDSWSVSTEVFAYTIFPLLLLVTVKRSLLMSAVSITAAIGTLTFISTLHYGVRGPLDAYRDDNSTLPLIRCLAGFSLGLATYRFSQVAFCKNLLSGEKAIVTIILCCLLAFLFDKTDVLTVVLLAPLIICLYYDGKTSEAVFGNKLIHHLGEISYSLYLLHPFFMGVAGHYKVALESRFGSWPVIFIMLGIAMTWIAAYISFLFIERPGRRFFRSVWNETSRKP